MVKKSNRTQALVLQIRLDPTRAYFLSTWAELGPHLKSLSSAQKFEKYLKFFLKNILFQLKYNFKHILNTPITYI